MSDEAHVTALTPAVALALAAWLDTTATHVNRLGGGYPAVHLPALTVARVYLGTAT